VKLYNLIIIKDYKTFLNKKISNSIYLTPPSTTKIFSIISSLNVAKASSYDDIASYFLKICVSTLAPFLEFYFMKAFEFGIFPKF